MDDAAVRVAQHLDLDVAGVADVALDEDAAVAEGRSASPEAWAQAPASSLGGLDPAHAAPAAAAGRLEQHRVADPLGDRARPPPRVATTSEPSLIGTPSSRASARAVALSPLRRIASAEGPTKAIPSSSQAAAQLGRARRGSRSRGAARRSR